MAAGEARSGRKDNAEQLRKLVQAARSGQSRQKPAGETAAIPIARPKGELQALLSVQYPKSTLDEMALDAKIAARLRGILEQQSQRELLRSFGKVPSTRLLLAGPPGSGKTMTAAALAGELHIPLFTVRLDTLITRYLGETAAKLRLIFDHIATTRGVFLFDEFDAIGGDRGADNDIGEMRRILNSFLQFMEEETRSDSLIVAATNYPELLDFALARRFDDVVVYAMPDTKAARKVIERHLGLFRPRQLQWAKILPACEGLSHAEIARAVDDVIKRAILDGEAKASSAKLLAALRERASAKQALSGRREP
ncbi:AAA family ATPase [Hyphomicrobium sp.]|uniref:AAA family ATPase n=1 Tax=Hyphomicrobium sp. TaxID=82 RepID=UPI002FE0511E